jgi:hypothetical protein
VECKIAAPEIYFAFRGELVSFLGLFALWDLTPALLPAEVYIYFIR